MLRIANLTVHYESKIALENISLEALPGQCLVIEGQNGAGKSTLFNAVSGKLSPSAGEISIDNTNISRWPEHKCASLIARLTQNVLAHAVPTMTVAENLAMAALKSKRARLVNWQRPQEFEDFPFDIGSVWDKPLNSLSGGQQQMIAFAMATLIEPRVLLLDEPTAALDTGATREWMSYMLGYIREHQVVALLITHDPSVARMGHGKIFLEKGRLAGRPSPDFS